MTSFYTLIVSLPRHGRDYKVKQLPISRLQLEKRLKFLSVLELAMLNKLISLVWDSWFSRTESITDMRLRAKDLLQLQNPLVTEVIAWYFDIRSLLVALRLRHAKKTVPVQADLYLITRWSHKIINQWHEPEFGLKSVFPWLTALSKLIEQNDSAAVEDLILIQLWKHLDFISNGHHFDFEAVIIYLLRWQIVNHWSQFSESIAQNRIDHMTNQLLADH